jgi:hypothetical protein
MVRKPRMRRWLTRASRVTDSERSGAIASCSFQRQIRGSAMPVVLCVAFILA